MYQDDIPYDDITWHELKHRFTPTVQLSDIFHRPGDGQNGIKPIFNRDEVNNRWPDEIIPGWNGGHIQFTLGIIVKYEGKWHGIAPLEFWSDRKGAPREWTGQLIGNWHNWSYNFETFPGRAYPTESGVSGWSGPKVGDVVGFVMFAGDRREKDIGDIYERSNILRVKLVENGYCIRIPGDVNTVPVPPTDDNSPVPPVHVPDASSSEIVTALMQMTAAITELKEVVEQQGKEIKELKNSEYVSNQDGTIDFLGQRKFKIVSKLTRVEK